MDKVAEFPSTLGTVFPHYLYSSHPFLCYNLVWATIVSNWSSDLEDRKHEKVILWTRLLRT